MTSAGIKRKEGGEKIHLESWWRGFSPFDWNTYPRGIIPMYLSGRVGIEIQKKKKKREEGWVGSARVGGEVRAPLKFMLGILAVVPGQFFFQLQPRAILCPPPSPFLHTYTLHATLYSQLSSLSLPPSLERAALSLSLSLCWWPYTERWTNNNKYIFPSGVANPVRGGTSMRARTGIA